MSQAPTLVVYHNARCSKSRAACQLIAEHGAEARIVNYLETPPSRETLRELLGKLGIAAADLVRRGESVFKEHYAGRTLSEDEWLDALIAHPILNSSLSNCVVLDPFGGSGSTLIACEQTERVCHMIELDEKYCDVIVKRYIEQVGNSDKVILVREGVKTLYDEVPQNTDN